ncbi:Sugar phosphate isomerase/epimerase [Haladaptatus litoreus]|uniref:Sugar phosphate isomerase/epimerase n=1 Tax=Haladaptatus litoreus TaxID=553468 RepID=A0A1N7B6H5_9EURY|nr:sugar phosphate isomerase/epimerase [Haladaptatus litoreus]SIR46960.1 Sugar phosphate isomerase/epimerase [Haladaptatus litoreus]
MTKTAIQLYSLRELDESLLDLLARVGETNFDGVEFAGLGGETPETVAEALDTAGLGVAGAHVPFEELEANPADVVETYRKVGCDHLVVPYLDESHFDTEKTAVETAHQLDDLAERVAEAGAELSYHNHDHEFVEIGDRTAFDAFIAESNLNIELDVGWVVAAGRDPISLLDCLSGRTPLVHLKDTADGTPVELGDGDVDMGACADTARSVGAEWLVYEHDDPNDPEASLLHGAERLTELNKRP